MTPLPPWVLGLLIIGSFLVGFSAAALTACWMWWSQQTTGSINPMARGGKVLAPGPDAEQRASQMAYEEALESGAREILAEAKASGLTLSWEDARASARQALTDVFPDAALRE